MSLVDHLKHPTHCFCQIPFHELEKWFRKHYEEGYSTQELLASTDDAQEKEVICIVSMFELDDDSVIRIMGDVNLPEHHILHCREHFREKLQQLFGGFG